MYNATPEVWEKFLPKLRDGPLFFWRWRGGGGGGCFFGGGGGGGGGGGFSQANISSYAAPAASNFFVPPSPCKHYTIYFSVYSIFQIPPPPF